MLSELTCPHVHKVDVALGPYVLHVQHILITLTLELSADASTIVCNLTFISENSLQRHPETLLLHTISIFKIHCNAWHCAKLPCTLVFLL